MSSTTGTRSLVRNCAVSSIGVMNIQDVVVVVLRLLALDFLLRVAVQLTPQILQMLRLFAASPGDSSRFFAVLPWLVLAGLTISAVLLWILALPIARLVTRGVSQELSFGEISLVDCYSIAFMSVGLFYVAGHFPQVLNWAHYLLKAAASHAGNSWKETIEWYQVSQAFIPFIMGAILFANGRRWAVALARRQEESSRPATPPE